MILKNSNTKKKRKRFKNDCSSVDIIIRRTLSISNHETILKELQ